MALKIMVAVEFGEEVEPSTGRRLVAAALDDLSASPSFIGYRVEAVGLTVEPEGPGSLDRMLADAGEELAGEVQEYLDGQP